MKISQTEHKIKNKLSQREITPSQNLWDNIEQELDKTSKSKSNKIWLKYVSIVAVLCVGVFVYQGLKPETGKSTQLVLKSKPVIEKEKQLKLNTTSLSYVASPSTIQTKNTLKFNNETSKNKTQVKNSIAEDKKPSIEVEVDNLLSQAQNALTKSEKEKQLIDEVNILLAEAMQQTQDKDQQQILQDLKATALLAEIEAEIELQKPPNLKDRIWTALVSNLNNIKRTVVSN
ncbi:hypothetical protein [Psychroflexus sp. MBR-150]|jgi:hypothetical protein